MENIRGTESVLRDLGGSLALDECRVPDPFHFYLLDEESIGKAERAGPAGPIRFEPAGVLRPGVYVVSYSNGNAIGAVLAAPNEESWKAVFPGEPVTDEFFFAYVHDGTGVVAIRFRVNKTPVSDGKKARLNISATPGPGTSSLNPAVVALSTDTLVGILEIVYQGFLKGWLTPDGEIS